ncbi:MAG: UbiA family prenyltransferase [Planctomycetaceae bacterium]|nr:UbiA family prenyltransferase [Planctomycetaceae bacterium]
MNQTLLGLLRLVRFSNTPTAVADIAAGYMLAQGSVADWPPLVALSVASVCLYSFGMVLNDLNDLDEDRIHNPKRPLVTGAISVRTARQILGLLVAVAVVGTAVAGWLFHTYVVPGFTLGTEAAFLLPPWSWSLVIMAALLTSIWLYDGPLKRSFIAPFLMGSCRGWNLLLGASLPALTVVSSVEETPNVTGPWSHWTTDVWLCALAMTCYVTGITWYARSESSGPKRWHLYLGLFFLSLGLALLAFGLVWLPNRPVGRAAIGSWQKFEIWWPLAMTLLSYSVLRKAINGALLGTEKSVRAAIISALGSLVLLNGAICLYANPQEWQVALAVAALTIPIKFLRSSIPPT